MREAAGGPAPPELGALRAHAAGAGAEPEALGGGGGPWEPAVWRGALEEAFLGEGPAGREADDLVFFAHRRSGEGGGGGGGGEVSGSGGESDAGETGERCEVLGEPREGWEVLVRRKTPATLRDLGPGVDWARSFYLNLVLHAQYQLTVAICRGSDLAKHRAGRAGPATPLMKVTRTVYASPSRVSVDPASEGRHPEAEPQPAYPDICFTVHDFAEAFGEVVASRPSDQCLCVLLSCTGCSALDGGGGRRWKKVCVFSGFVSQEQLCGALEPRQNAGGFFGLFGGAGRGAPPPRRLVRLQGPNGKGSAEVAVTEMRPEEGETEAAAEGRGGFFRHLGRADGAGGGGGGGGGLQCCIMSVSVPWYHLARDLVVLEG